MSLIQRIDALLPQTQCGKCGHPGCKPYAEGLSGGEAINKCPPGGDETIAQLAQLLRVPVIALDTDRGLAPSQVAFIREAECIGCTKCIQACPVDAIVGAAKLMHTVIVDECTGCDLCVAPCPVDCIEMRPLPPATTAIVGGLAFSHTQYQTRLKKRDHARHRFESRKARLKREDDQRLSERLARARKTLSGTAAPQAEAGNSPSGNAAANSETAMKQARIAVAMSRAQLNKSLKAFGHPPIAEQAARLVELQREFERAEHALETLKAADSGPSTAIVSKPDNAALNRAKLQVAMRRATLKKAFAAQAPADQIETLNAAVIEAERMLSELEMEMEMPAGFGTNS
ncbi:electron transport complex subunit RsxB [Pseudomonas huanghezhanensis]|uniref:electron transport complex subunit RsxB n=1 Tax=Pseudomonas huanghezhanensis TaxID=3002903 RepID=UPI002285BC7A|nr:electron transport complex subunit RsxB [Pseudomonas sp. BSw22131]